MTTVSTVHMIYVGNFADMDTQESDSDNESPDNVLGTHDNLQLFDIEEVDVDDDGAIYDNEFGTGDYLSYDTGGGTTNVYLDSSSLYNAEILLGDGSTMSVPVIVIQAANGDVFISDAPDHPLDGLAIQSISLISLETSDWAGIIRGNSTVENSSIVCFAPGTLIETPDGTRPVEALKPGDTVWTLDHGPQTIRWTRSSDHPLEDAKEGEKPVLIRAGTLGHNIPAQDLIVSPQHRILVGGRQMRDAFTDEVFAPAKSLTTMPGIRTMKGKKSITWIHFACDKHEVVFANGCMTESLLLGPMVLNGLPPRERRALTAIYGRAATPDAAINGPPARDCLTAGEVQRHLIRHRNEASDRLAAEISKWDRDLAMDLRNTPLRNDTFQNTCAG